MENNKYAAIKEGKNCTQCWKSNDDDFFDHEGFIYQHRVPPQTSVTALWYIKVLKIMRIHFQKKKSNKESWTVLPDVRIFLVKYEFFKFIWITHWKHISIYSGSGARGSKNLPFLKYYNALERESSLWGLTLQKLPIISKFKQKLRRIKFFTEKLTEHLPLPTP